MKNRKVLFVDDEVNLLRSLQRNLRRTYDITVAEGGVAALTQILQNGPFAVIVSDLQMPEIDGVQVLTMARILTPDTFRIMLTGNVTSSISMYGADQKPWFQYLNKPCSTERLCQMLNEGIDRPKGITPVESSDSCSGEGDELRKQLRFKQFQEDALPRNQRLRELVQNLGKVMRFAETWQYELAIMLSQISQAVGPVSPRSAGQDHSNDLSDLRDEAESSSELIRRIPRLECIAEMVRLQYSEELNASISGNIHRGARLLRMLRDYEVLTRTESEAMAIRRMEPRSAFYGDDIFRNFSELILANHPGNQPDHRTLTASTLPEQTFESLTGRS